MSKEPRYYAVEISKRLGCDFDIEYKETEEIFTCILDRLSESKKIALQISDKLEGIEALKNELNHLMDL